MTICDSLRLFPLNLHIYEDYGDFLYFFCLLILNFYFSYLMRFIRSMSYQDIFLIIFFIKLSKLDSLKNLNFYIKSSRNFFFFKFLGTKFVLQMNDDTQQA